MAFETPQRGLILALENAPAKTAAGSKTSTTDETQDPSRVGLFSMHGRGGICFYPVRLFALSLWWNDYEVAGSLFKWPLGITLHIC